MAKPALPSYAPIRARIQAALAPADRAQDTVTEICILVAAIAHGQEDAWLQKRAADLGDQEARQWLEEAHEAFAEDIAAVLAVGQALEAHLVALGFSTAADIEAGVNLKLHLEFFELPALARRALFGRG
jgi:hypothetical protein